jgi:hypothetical protein
MVELPYGVGIGINAEDAAVVQGLLVPAPVEIKPPRLRIDLHGDAALGAGFQDFIDVDLISGAPCELTWPIIVV